MNGSESNMLNAQNYNSVVCYYDTVNHFIFVYSLFHDFVIMEIKICDK